jgi:CheY-like chemotaxis protein
LEAHSDGLGRGSEFIVSLPVLAASSAEPAAGGPAGVPRERDQNQKGPGRGKRVLIVDDNRDAAEMLGMLVRLWEHEVAMAHDGRSALEVAAGFRPDVVLLDLGLPELDGYEVARRMRRHPDLAEVLLVAVSGYGRPEDLQRTREAGFDEHLVKPVDPQVLAELLAAPYR